MCLFSGLIAKAIQNWLSKPIEQHLISVIVPNPIGYLVDHVWESVLATRFSFRPQHIVKTSPLEHGEPCNHPILGHVLLWGPRSCKRRCVAYQAADELEKVYGHCVWLVEPGRERRRQESSVSFLARDIPYGAIVFVNDVDSMIPSGQECVYWMTHNRDYPGNRLRQFTLVGATAKLQGLYQNLPRRFPILIELDDDHIAESVRVLEEEGGSVLQNGLSDISYSHIAAGIILRAHVQALCRPSLAYLPGEVVGLASERSLGDVKVNQWICQHLHAFGSLLGGLSVTQAEIVMGLLGVDENGLRYCDRRVIKALSEHGTKVTRSEDLASQTGLSVRDLDRNVVPRLIAAGTLDEKPEGLVLTGEYWKARGVDFGKYQDSHDE